MIYKELNKNLETVKINISKIIEADKNKILNTLYDKNIKIIYDEIDDNPTIKIKSNNKNYIIICNKIENNYDNITIMLMGKKNGNLILENNENYYCFAHHKSKGDGHVIVLGSGYSSAFRENKGNGHSIKLGSGRGNSYRGNKGIGHAIKIGNNYGNASKYGSGYGHAIKLGSGKGDAIIQNNNKNCSLNLLINKKI